MLLLQQMLGIDTGYEIGMEVYVYTNNYYPTPSSLFAFFDVATGTGLAGQGLDPEKWTMPAYVSDHPYMYYNPTGYITFTNETGSTVTLYGYVVANSDVSWGLWAERFDTPRVLAPGASFNLQLTAEGGLCPLPTPPPPP